MGQESETMLTTKSTMAGYYEGDNITTTYNNNNDYDKNVLKMYK